MKIAIVHPIPLVPGTIDLHAYARRFEELGHESLMVTSQYLRGDSEIPVVERSLQEMADPATWRALGIDVAVTFVWFQYPEISETLAAAGCRVVARADSDGQQSIRVFPGSYFRCMVGAAQRGRKSIEFKSYLHRYLVRYRAEDRSLLRTVAASNSVAIETHEAAKNLRWVLGYYGQTELARKIVVIPHCINDAFLTSSVDVDRSETVISIGRWTAAQKNPELLLGVIRRQVAKCAKTRFIVIGPGASALCGNLAEQTGRIECHDQVPLTRIPHFLSRARVLLSSSRWEGSPISANEALASGCSVVGTPIPAFIDIARTGPFGTVSNNHRIHSLQQALQSELIAWETGRRRPMEIAAHWRPRVSQQRVIEQILAAACSSEQASPAAAEPEIRQTLAN
jgi:glycosyltransferase involved in cell wall biosynthesis